MNTDPPSEEQLRELAHKDVLLNRTFELQKHLNWTYVEALSFAVSLMAEDREYLHKELAILQAERCAPRIFILPKEEPNE